MIGYHFQALSQFAVVGKDRTAIAIASQILRWEERCTADQAHRAGLYRTAVREGIIAADSLCIIFNYRQVVLVGKCQQWLHICRLTIQMNGYYRLGFRSDRLFQAIYIHRKSIRIHIYEYRGELQ